VRQLGLFRQRLCWIPTLRGWFLFVVLIVAAAGGFAKWVHSFLARTHPMHGSILVVEGWLPDYALKNAMSFFQTNGYRTMILTGVEIEKGSHLSFEKNYARLAADTLKHFGFDEHLLVLIESSDIQRNRTYATALAVKTWLDNHGSPRTVDVFTLGPHARRTWLLFQLALGKHYQVGVISCPDEGYDPSHWWKSSRGVRQIVDELVAYVYAKCLFYP